MAGVGRAALVELNGESEGAREVRLLEVLGFAALVGVGGFEDLLTDGVHAWCTLKIPEDVITIELLLHHPQNPDHNGAHISVHGLCAHTRRKEVVKPHLQVRAQYDEELHIVLGIDQALFEVDQHLLAQLVLRRPLEFSRLDAGEHVPGLPEQLGREGMHLRGLRHTVERFPEAVRELTVEVRSRLVLTDVVGPIEVGLDHTLGVVPHKEPRPRLDEAILVECFRVAVQHIILILLGLVLDLAILHVEGMIHIRVLLRELYQRTPLHHVLEPIHLLSVGLHEQVVAPHNEGEYECVDIGVLALQECEEVGGELTQQFKALDTVPDGYVGELTPIGQENEVVP